MTEEKPIVYVVDDDPSIRKALGRLLRSSGYPVATFESAEDFLESLSELRHGCLVLDIDLPGISGLDLYERLSSTQGRYLVVFMTAHDNPRWQERARVAGAVAYMRKPFDEQSLIDAVRLSLKQAGGDESRSPTE